MKRCHCKAGASAKLDASGWLLSGVLLLLVPKCPACLAGYIMALTGLGLSFPAAAGLRWTLLGLAVASLVVMTIRLLKRLPTFRRPQ